MFKKVFRKVFGSRNDRIVRKMQKAVDQINGLEEQFETLSDEALQGKTVEFRSRLDQGASLDELLPEAFATVREASKRVFEMRHYDVQLIGGMVLHQGKIAEMRTGEGKTLMATLAVYLNALPGNGVHVVTVNDYLASRDAGWMGQLYNFLGMSVGVVIPALEHEYRQQAYAAGYACRDIYAQQLGSPPRRRWEAMVHWVLDRVLTSPPDIWAGNFYAVLAPETENT